MRYIPLMLMLAMALGLAGTPVHADDAAPLTLADCLGLAVKYQIDSQIGRNTVESAKARVVQTQSGYFPQISLQTSSNLLQNDTGFGNGQGYSTTSLAIAQSIYDGGTRAAQLRGAQAGVAESRATLARTLQTVTYNVTRNYLALLRAQQLAGVQDAQVSYLEGQTVMIRARVQAGDAADVDVLPVEAQLANARVDRLSANNAIRTASLALQAAIGLEPGDGFRVADVPPPAPKEVPAMAELVKAALAKRPELAQQRAAIQSAKAATDAAKIALRPKLVITGQLDQPLLSDLSRAFSINGGIAFDIFDGNLNRAILHGAQLTQSTAELRAQQAEKDVRVDVQMAYLTVQNATERLSASAMSQQAAQKNFDAQQERYQQGLAIPLDLLNASVALTTAKSNLAQARYDYLTALAQLEYALGGQGG